MKFRKKRAIIIKTDAFIARIKPFNICPILGTNRIKRTNRTKRNRRKISNKEVPWKGSSGSSSVGKLSPTTIKSNRFQGSAKKGLGFKAHIFTDNSTINRRTKQWSIRTNKESYFQAGKYSMVITSVFREMAIRMLRSCRKNPFIRSYFSTSWAT